MITNKEAERRGKEYDTEGMTYLFDLDYTDDMDEVFTVDAGIYGNISHFVNHSVCTDVAVIVLDLWFKRELMEWTHPKSI